MLYGMANKRSLGEHFVGVGLNSTLENKYEIHPDSHL